MIFGQAMDKIFGQLTSAPGPKRNCILLRVLVTSQINHIATTLYIPVPCNVIKQIIDKLCIPVMGLAERTCQKKSLHKQLSLGYKRWVLWLI